MSTTTFVEATSADPYVRELHRRAMRILNDPSLDRHQRERHVRRLQAVLLMHQAKVEAKAKRLAEKKEKRGALSRTNGNNSVANPKEVLSRRKEFLPREQKAVRSVEVSPVIPTPMVTASNDNLLPGRNRPVLTLRRA